jgi:hypothetical protein
MLRATQQQGDAGGHRDREQSAGARTPRIHPTHLKLTQTAPEERRPLEHGFRQRNELMHEQLEEFLKVVCAF